MSNVKVESIDLQKQMKKFSKGFTIVELLVVIAIIAVLAAIVLVNVTQYIAKAKDAAQEGNLTTILTNSAVFYDANSTYVGYHSNNTFTNPASAIYNAGSGVSFLNYAESSTAFCACAKLDASTTIGSVTGQYYCVDSTGNKKLTTTVCGTVGTNATVGSATADSVNGDECSSASTSNPYTCQ